MFQSRFKVFALRFSFLLLALIISSASVFAFSLTKNTRISLLTASPGEELYSTFGHNALRFCDTTTKTDLVFNYGTFDFNTPHFYVKFCRGSLKYQLAVERFDRFMEEYIDENRTVREQVLNLDSTETLRLIGLISENYKPENRYYQYDFFYDNCATRIRDIIAKSSDSPVIWPEKPAEPVETFRSLYRLYLIQMPWTKFGIDLLMGLPSDRVTNVYLDMYLPDRVHDAVQYAKYQDERPLMKSYSTLFEAASTPVSASSFARPIFICWIIFILGILCFLNRTVSRIFNVLLFTSVGLLGLLIAFFGLATLHVPTHNNLNIIWALPFHAIFIYFTAKRWAKVYFFISALLAVLFLISWPILPQEFNFASLPIILLLAIRSFAISSEVGRKTLSRIPVKSLKSNKK
jgi:hypothetical protein